MLKRSYFTSITVVFISLLVLAEWSSADMTIDDFSSSLDDWDPYGIYVFDEKAIFNEGNYDDTDPSAPPT